MKTVTRRVSDAELDRQIAEAKTRGVSEPEAKSASYRDGEVLIELVSGWNFSFDPRRFVEFANATEKELTEIGLWGRYTLACDPLDVHISIGGIILELLGDRFINSEVNRRRGSITNEKKRSASQANGKLGGRPKKVSLK